MRRTVFVATVIILAMAMAACSGSGKVSNPGNPGDAVSEPSSDSNSAAATGTAVAADEAQTAADMTGGSPDAETAGSMEIVSETSGISENFPDASTVDNKPADGDNRPAEKQQTGTDGKSTGVVAKSNNIVSGQDNGVIMKELDRELDDLFSSINKLDDVGDAELNDKGDGDK